MQPARKSRTIYETAGQANIPRYLGRKEKSNRRGNGNRQDRKKPQSARRPGGTPNSENRKFEKFRERRKKERWKRRRSEEFMKN
jgi:hypothetical protein